MTEERTRQVLRLPKKHAARTRTPPDLADGERACARAISSRRDHGRASRYHCIQCSLGVFVDDNSPDFSLACRRSGRAYWVRRASCRPRPGLAISNYRRCACHGLVRLQETSSSPPPFTAGEFDTGTITILRGVTAMTWPVFFDEAMTPVDAVYALFGAAVAAFYANRRLDRSQYLALRTWQQKARPKD